MPHILQAYQEYEKLAQEWSEYTGRLMTENDELKRQLERLECEKKHIGECDETQKQMILTQNDLISSLKHETARHLAQTSTSSLAVDPSLPLETCEVASEAGSCISESFPARLLKAIPNSPDGDEED
ncbi:hypothetical protein HIM_12208 [Hirsutella minnesotensis 3608]|uniref:Uncharacterized protein n=1 Tax=Hirsutella minnesotensis 3608 TaxID=1043627 RepID=A0A0F7ZW59_9HYPO|nr:hypothetical protein HIM_12208 [Hirsutella minnesotensis 3608]